MSQRYPHVWPARMDIRLRNGSSLSAAVEEVDWSPRRPASWSDLTEKFSTMAEPLIGASNVRDVVRLIEDLDDVKDISPLMNCLSPTRA